MTDQTEREKLLPCPYCNKPLTQRGGVNPYANCRTEGCFGGRMPVVSLQDPVMVAQWNNQQARAALDTATGRELTRLPAGYELTRRSHDICLSKNGYNVIALPLDLHRNPSFNQGLLDFFEALLSAFNASQKTGG